MARRYLLTFLFAFVLLTNVAKASSDDVFIAPFSLTDQNGDTITRDDLAGKVWVASFILCDCPDSKCPQVMRTVARLQDELVKRPEVMFITFTVNPDKDSPARLKSYAEAHGADPERWLFLTGSYEQIDKVLQSFKVRASGAKKSDLAHSQKLVLVGKRGQIVGYYDGLRNVSYDTEADFEANLTRLKKDIDTQFAPDLPDWAPRDFPRFNALLNALAAVLILLGYVAVRQRLLRLHITCMLSAVLVSAVFLASYLFYHLVIKKGQPTRFADQAPDAPEWVAIAYAVILLTHTVLAVFATPMALISTYFGLRDRIAAHRKLARWTFPIWLYVSVTGVVVYWLLYRAYSQP